MYPCKPHFYCTKVGFKVVKTIFVMTWTMLLQISLCSHVCMLTSVFSILLDYLYSLDNTIKIYVKLPRKCHNHEAQPSHGTKRRRDIEQTITQTINWWSFSYFPRIWRFMQFVVNGDNLYEMSKPVFSEIWNKKYSAEIFTQSAKHKNVDLQCRLYFISFGIIWLIVVHLKM